MRGHYGLAQNAARSLSPKTCGIPAAGQPWMIGKRTCPKERKLYDRFEKMIAECGEYYVAPAKTRIAFMGRVRFAGITRLSEQGMTCSFSLPALLNSPRFVKVVEIVPGWWVHQVRITESKQLDEELQRWLGDSYRLMGMQQRLKLSEKRKRK